MQTTEPTFSAEQIAEHVSTLQASIETISRIIASGEREPLDVMTMDRNVRHIEIMLGMAHIKEAGVDLAPHRAAIASGKTWLAAS